MEDFKKLSVEQLRQLARKLLGKVSGLRTRAQLLEALSGTQRPPRVPAAPRPAPSRAAKKPGGPVRKEAKAPVRKEASASVAKEAKAPVRKKASAAVRKEVSAPVRKEVSAPVRKEVSTPVRKKATDPVRKETPLQEEASASVPKEVSVPARKKASVPRKKRVLGEQTSPAVEAARNGVLPAAADASSNGTPRPPVAAPEIVPLPAPQAERRSPRVGERAVRRVAPAPAQSSRPAPRPLRAVDGAPGPADGSPGSPDVPVPGAEPPLESAFFDGPPAPRRPRRPLPSLQMTEPPVLPLPLADVGTESPVLLVRDPSTLFVFWDFRRELERGAALGLAEPRLLLRLFHGERLDRSVELPLGTRSTYLEGLRPGEAYAAEVTLLGRDGWTRPMGRRSGPRRLPPDGPSERVEVRTLHVPWTDPLPRVAQPSEVVEVSAEEPLDSPRRVPLPTSPGNRGGGRGPSGPLRSGRS